MGSRKDDYWHCPIYGCDINEWLCWEVSNVGNDSLHLKDDESPPCGWDEANKICAKCKHYEGWN